MSQHRKRHCSYHEVAVHLIQTTTLYSHIPTSYTLRHFLHTLLLLLLLPVSHGITKAGERIVLCHPTADKGDEVWFHSILTAGRLPEKAVLTIATTGHALIYVNGRIAMTAAIWPYRPHGILGMAARDIDITDFLTIGRNVISVWYAPCRDSWSSGQTGQTWAEQTKRGQIAASITTVTEGKETVTCDREQDWLCTIATGRITEYGEDFDALAYQKDWKEFIYGFSPAWIGTERAEACICDFHDIPDIALHACKTYEPLSIVQDKDTTRCYFPPEAEGQIRLTLRKTGKGRLISVNGMRYRCIGTDDEQFFTRFTTHRTDSLTVTSLDGKPIPEIAGAEIIVLKPTDTDKTKEEQIWKR